MGEIEKNSHSVQVTLEVTETAGKLSVSQGSVLRRDDLGISSEITRFQALVTRTKILYQGAMVRSRNGDSLL